MVRRVCDGYVALITDLLLLKPRADPRSVSGDGGPNTLGINLESLVASARSDREVVGGKYSTACYIGDSWPSLPYLANTNLGGENAHRGAVLGGIV